MDWSKSIEKETWLKYFDEFGNGVKWVIDNLELLLPYISSNNVEESEKERMKKYMIDEHLRINSEIRDGTVSYERISNYQCKSYSSTFEQSFLNPLTMNKRR